MNERIEDQPEIINVEAEIKADLFTEIFDSMTKNMKENEKIYFIFTHKQMKMWISESSKTTQLQLKIGAKAFKEYVCHFDIKQSIFRKYELKKFLWFPSFFQSCKGIFKLLITEDKIEFEDPNNGSRTSRFPVQGQEISRVEEDDLKNTNVQTEIDEKNSCLLMFPKSKTIQQVIHSGNAMKVAKLWLTYISNEKKLKFDFKANDGPFLKVKAQQQQSKGGKLTKIPFPFRKLKLATSLIESQKPFKMTLSQNALMIHYDEENIRRYSISVLAQLDD